MKIDLFLYLDNILMSLATMFSVTVVEDGELNISILSFCLNSMNDSKFFCTFR